MATRRRAATRSSIHATESSNDSEPDPLRLLARRADAVDEGVDQLVEWIGLVLAHDLAHQVDVIAQDVLDDGGQELVLALEVVVERGGRDPEILREMPQRRCVIALFREAVQG